mgnify:FL=1|jgi:hypothetical protein
MMSRAALATLLFLSAAPGSAALPKWEAFAPSQMPSQMANPAVSHVCSSGAPAHRPPLLLPPPLPLHMRNAAFHPVLPGQTIPQRGRGRPSLLATSGSVQGFPLGDPQKLQAATQAAAGTALIVGFERCIWAVGQAMGKKIPTAPVGMLAVFVSLLILRAFSESVPQAIVDFFEPSLLFFQKGVPLFFSPPLVTLPAALSAFPVLISAQVLQSTPARLPSHPAPPRPALPFLRPPHPPPPPR